MSSSAKADDPTVLRVGTASANMAHAGGTATLAAGSFCGGYRTTGLCLGQLQRQVNRDCPWPCDRVTRWRAIPLRCAARYLCLHDRSGRDSAAVGSGRFEAGRARSTVVCSERGACRRAGWSRCRLSNITGLAPNTIERGLKDLDAPPLAPGQIRRKGGGSTKTGLKVERALDTRVYEKGLKITKAEMKHLDIRGDAFHPEWNYSIIPRKRKS
jgi:hypothetical protein